MYRHFLVPIDDSDLAVEVVGQAVALAHTLDARITFFHAVSDAASLLRGEAELLRRAEARADYEYDYLGKAREVLAKAEAAAGSRGVPCVSKQVSSDKPAQAIVEQARTDGCDLIVMASHGGRGRLGMAFASETVSVLMNARLPVLVVSTGEPAAAARAIGIIRDEHRSIAAVMHAWLHALAASRDDGTPVDPALMPAIVRYLKQFPDKMHHPKENEQLFRRLRERTSTCDEELEELERQHALDHQIVATLERQVEALPHMRAEARQRAIRDLENEVARYAAFLWRHLELEETVILPAAERHLLPADWKAIEAAFLANRDPLFRSDTDKTYRKLFSRIVNLDRAD